jgi:alpha-amylase/alpha-mannosidase (GH57 family)
MKNPFKKSTESVNIYHKVKSYEKKCEGCGKTFNSSVSIIKYCSDICQIKDQCKTEKIYKTLFTMGMLEEIPQKPINDSEDRYQ